MCRAACARSSVSTPGMCRRLLQGIWPLLHLSLRACSLYWESGPYRFLPLQMSLIPMTESGLINARALYLLPWLKEAPSLPHSGRTSSVLILVWAQGLLLQQGPLADLRSSSRLERPGRTPGGGLGCSPGLLPSIQGLGQNTGQGPCWSSQATPGVMV